MRVPLGMSRAAKQPMPCTLERRTSSHLLGGRARLALTFNLPWLSHCLSSCFFAFAMIRLPPGP